MSFVFALHKTTLKLERTMHKFTKALAAIGLAAVMSQSAHRIHTVNANADDIGSFK
ncbi:hypothetical protein ACUOCP_27020, partial [Escherichia sp. R-CC3]